ncbi:MAG: DUF202 domain-containing protein [Jiangellaceae bacterium]
MSTDGLSGERTALAWVRTALALLAAVLLAGRLAADRLGVVAAAFVLLAVPMAAVVLAGARRRYRAAHAAPAPTSGRDGRLPASVAVLVVVLALAELGYVLAA